MIAAAAQAIALTAGAQGIPPGIWIPAAATVFLGLATLLVGRLVKKPSYTEVWAEIRTVRHENRTLRDAFDVLYRYCDEMRNDWNKGKPLPEFSPHDREVIEKVRSIPDDPDDPSTEIQGVRP